MFSIVGRSPNAQQYVENNSASVGAQHCGKVPNVSSSTLWGRVEEGAKEMI